MSDTIKNEIANEIHSVKSTLARKTGQRSKLQIERNRREITELYLKGAPLHDIAEKTGLTVAVVKNDLGRIIKLWQKEQVMDMTVVKMVQLEKINLIEAELWDSWYQSKNQGRTLVTKRQSGQANAQAPSRQSQEIATEKSAGDMAYMNGIKWCIEQRNKLFGLYAPKKVAQTDVQGNDVTMGRDELMAIIDTMAIQAERNQNLLTDGSNVIDAVLVDKDNPEYDSSTIIGRDVSESYFIPEAQIGVTTIENGATPREETGTRPAAMSMEIARSIETLLQERPIKQ